MSSRQIAELLGARHDNVKRTIERVVERGVIVLPPLEEASFFDSTGRMQRTTEYLLNERSSYIVVAQLSPEFTAQLVDEWQRLKAKPALDLSDPQTLRGLLLQSADREIALKAAVREKATQPLNARLDTWDMPFF